MKHKNFIKGEKKKSYAEKNPEKNRRKFFLCLIETRGNINTKNREKKKKRKRDPSYDAILTEMYRKIMRIISYGYSDGENTKLNKSDPKNRFFCFGKKEKEISSKFFQEESFHRRYVFNREILLV